MTVTSNASVKQYTGNTSTTAFSFPYKTFNTTEFILGLRLSDPVVTCKLYLIWLNSTSVVNVAEDSQSVSAVTIVTGELSSISYLSTAVDAAVRLVASTRPALRNFLNNFAPTFILGPTITPVLVEYK